MEEKIRQWLEELDLFSIKSEIEMKLAYHRFISGCKDAGIDVTEWENFADLQRFVKTNHVRLKTDGFKAKKFQSVYHAAKTCSSDDAERKVLHGFFITEKRDQIVSTDGRRLLILPYSGSLPSGSWDLHTGKSLRLLNKMTYDEYKTEAAKEDVTHPVFDMRNGFCAPRNLVFADGLWFNPVEGTYPNYMSVVPNKMSSPEAITQEWLNTLFAVKRLYGLLGQVERLVNVFFQDWTTTFNSDFLLDGIYAISAFCGYEWMKIMVDHTGGGNAFGPCTITCKNSNALYALMPYRDFSDKITVNYKPGTEISLPEGEKRQIKLHKIQTAEKVIRSAARIKKYPVTFTVDGMDFKIIKQEDEKLVIRKSDVKEMEYFEYFIRDTSDWSTSAAITVCEWIERIKYLKKHPEGVEPEKADPVESSPVEVPAIVESNIIVARPAPIETPVSKPEVPDVPEVTADSSPAPETSVAPVKPVVRFVPGLPDDDNGVQDVAEESPVQYTNRPVGSKYARTQEERRLNNLKFEQMTIYNGIRRMESRLAFIHRILDEGETLSPSTYVDKKGKPHYVVNKNFLGKTAYEYAESLLNGGERITA